MIQHKPITYELSAKSMIKRLQTVSSGRCTEREFNFKSSPVTLTLATPLSKQTPVRLKHDEQRS